MTCLRVVTESGSVYRLDTAAKTLVRTPGEGAATAAFDGELLEYEYLVHGPNVGVPVLAYWDDNGPKLRITTPVVSIEEIPSE